MMCKIVRLTCWSLLLAFPMAVMAADVNVAMLSGSGVVKVNGAAVPRSATVYSGDKVATEKDSTVVITGKSAVMVLPSDSAVVYGGKKIQMQYGRALVNAQTGTEIRLANLTITPAEPRAKVQLRSGATLTVAALQGSVNVTDGVYHVILPAGQMMTRMASADEPAPPAPPVATVGSAIPGWVTAAVSVGVVGGAVGGMAAAGVFSSGTTSPTSPK